MSKKLSDLPLAGSINPEDLLYVVGADTQSRGLPLSLMINYEELPEGEGGVLRLGNQIGVVWRYWDITNPISWGWREDITWPFEFAHRPVVLVTPNLLRSSLTVDERRQVGTPYSEPSVSFARITVPLQTGSTVVTSNYDMQVSVIAIGRILYV